MYKVYFEESFFIGLNSFIVSMKDHYYYFYNNTWLYDEDTIIQSYFEIYEKMKTDVLNEINSICKNWIIGRKLTYAFENIENCSFTYRYWNYKISFTAIKNNANKKIIVNALKIEI